MDKREEVIFNIFGDWAAECRRQYVENFENEEEKRHIKELRDAATEALSHANEDAPIHWFGQRKDKFERAAYQYFLHGLHLGDRLYRAHKERLERFDEKWEFIEGILSKSKTTAEAIESLYEMPLGGGSYDGFNLMTSLENDRGYEISILQHLDLNHFADLIFELKKSEHDERFSEKAVFEKAGRHFATTIFAANEKSKGRPAKRSNLNTMRAYQIGDLVENINEGLSTAKLELTTIKEVCELTFGDGRKIDEHPQSPDIKWALEVYFRAKNRTVGGFLNSVSRGRAILSQDRYL